MADLYRPDEEIRVHPDNLVERRSFLEVGVMAVLVGIIPKSLKVKPSIPTEDALQIWTTAEGRRIRICDMADDHLRNCIFYMNKVYGFYHPTEVMWGSASDHFRLYDAMRREANRRKLSWI